MYSTIENLDCVEYKEKFSSFDFDVYSQLLKELEFNSDEESSIFIYGKRIPIPRKQVAFGENGTFYRFSGIKVTPKPFEDSKTISLIRDQLNEKLGLEFNFVLVNYYENGSHYINYHSDDEHDLDGNYPIASLSFGQERPFRLRNKKTKETYQVTLKNNSCILMKPPCQSLYQHSIPKTAKKIGGRLNLTFRRIKV